MRVKHFPWVLWLALLALAAFGSLALARPEKPCNDLCMFIKNVLKEESTGFAKFKGKKHEADNRSHYADWWEGTYNPSGGRCEVITQRNIQGSLMVYGCAFGTSAAPTSADAAKKKYAELREAFKEALAEGWEFEESHYMWSMTVATQTSTKVEVDAQLWWVQGKNEGWAFLYFHQRPPAGAGRSTN